MTTGTIIRDDRRTVIIDGVSHAQVGDYFRKNWSGLDDPINHSKENTYDMSVEATRNPLCQYRLRGSNDPWITSDYNGSGFGVVPPLDFATLTENDQIQLILKLDQEIRGHQFDASVFLGESKEAMQMVATRTSQIYQGLMSLRRGNVAGFAKAIGVRSRNPRYGGSVIDPGKVWLEYEYGWRPLVHDLNDGAEAFFALTNKPLTKTYKASKKVRNQLPETTSSSLITGEAVTIRALRAVVKENYTPWQSLGLDSPVSVAWELLPWSFVADWFIPFGNYLQARACLSRLNAAEISQTDKTYIFKQRLNFETPYWSYDIVGPGAAVKLVNVSRRSNVSLAVPTPRLKTMDKIATFRHMADAVALLLNFKEDKPQFWVY
jgi:hypothetical protein